MTENGHLTSYSLTLTVKTPVFVGSGKTYKKSDYWLDSSGNKINVLNREELFAYMARFGYVAKYETFILGGAKRSLYDFMKTDCHMDQATVNRCCKYTAYAGDAIDTAHSLKEINEFVKDSHDRAYIPGSSLKGALRTALLCLLIKREGTYGDVLLDSKEKVFSKEQNYFSKLNFIKSDKQNAALNDIMRGLEVSDSLPVSDDSLTVCTKIDVRPDRVVKKLPVCRECLKPGTKVKFVLTFDNSVLHDMITVNDVIEAISCFSEYYVKNYADKFLDPKKIGDFNYDRKLFLGGGVGYFSKTVTYPYLGYDKALPEVIKYFKEGKQSSKHHHDWDLRYNVSPHTLKYTSYDGKLLPFGLCEVDIK